MPNWSDKYQKHLINARSATIGPNGTSRGAYRSIYRVVAKALIDLDRDIKFNKISEARGRQYRAKLKLWLNELAGKISGAVDSSLTSAATKAIKSHEDALEELAESGLRTLPAYNFNGLAGSAAELSIIRRGLSDVYTPKLLIDRAVANLRSQVDDIINSGLIRGVSSTRLTKELGLFISKGDPEFNKILKGLGPRGGRIAGNIDDIPPQILKKAKNFLYQTRRIVVSEYNNAFHEANRLASVQSPVIKALKWQVSSRHFGLPSTPDVCTYNYEADQYGIGAGIFYPETLSMLTHPFCGCYTLAVFHKVQDWGTTGPTPRRAPKLTVARARRFYGKEKTAAFIKRQVEITNRLNKSAHDAYLKASRSAA